MLKYVIIYLENGGRLYMGYLDKLEKFEKFRWKKGTEIEVVVKWNVWDVGWVVLG